MLPLKDASTSKQDLVPSAVERGITTKARDNKLQVQEWTIGKGACGHTTSQECEDVSPAE